MDTPFRRILIIQNPASTNAQLASGRIEELQQAFPEACTIVKTAPGGRPANAKVLSAAGNQLGKDTLVCVAAGDGTVNMVVESLLSSSELPDEARASAILPLWGGNANDLAHMLNGSARRADIPTLVRTGKIVKVYPIICTLHDAHGNKTVRHAACYLSFGASATTAEILNKTMRHRGTLDWIPPVRFVRELSAVIPAMRRASTFMIRESGKQKVAYEYIFFKGSRFAKVSGVKKQLTDRTFHHVLVEHKRVADVMRFVSALSRRKQAAQFEGTHAEFTVLDDTWAQFDGEVVRIQADTQVKIAIADKPFYALSTRLSDDPTPAHS